MKKIALLILSVTTISSTLFAQNQEIGKAFYQEGWRIQVEAGYNISSMKVRIDGTRPKGSSIPGFHVGFKFAIPSEKKFSAELGLTVSTSGTAYKYSRNETEIDSAGTLIDFSFTAAEKVTYYNFVFPLEFKYKFGPEYVKYYWMFGGYFSAAMEGSLKSEVDYTERYGTAAPTTGSYEETTKIDYDNGGNRYDLGIIVGAGAEINERFLLGISYNYGAINQANNDFFPDKTVLRSRVIKISLGYRFQ